MTACPHKDHPFVVRAVRDPCAFEHEIHIPIDLRSIVAMNRVTKPLLASAALCAASLLPAHAEIDVAGLKAAIEKSVDADYPKLDALYKDIHQHPEIAFQEVKTAAKLAAEMRALGFEVSEHVGKIG